MEAKKYDYIRLEPSDNGGAILSYDEMLPPSDSKKDYMSCRSQSKKETYTKENIGEAVKKMFMMVGVKVNVMPSEGESENEEVNITINA